MATQNKEQLTVTEIVAKRDSAIAAAKDEYWREREKLAAEAQRKMDEAWAQYRRDMQHNLSHLMVRKAA